MGEGNNQLIAHIREKDQESQSLWDHLRETSEFSGQFAEKIGLKEAGEILGWLHDIGKASSEFQNYLGSANGLIDPDADEFVNSAALKGKIDHSSAGAQYLYKQLHHLGQQGIITAQVLSLCLASHHSGLIDCLTPGGINNFIKRIEKVDEKTHYAEVITILAKNEFQPLKDLLKSDIPVKQLIEKLISLKEDNDSQETLSFKHGLLIRFLFSCLLDADRLNTADFEFPENLEVRNYGNYPPWETLIQRLENKLTDFDCKPEKNAVDILRSQVSQHCLDHSNQPKGIYQLSVPTGGGKTFASLRFGLNHAAHHKMDRIFYIIPFTSIIDQNADEVRKILEDGDDRGRYLDKIVLEHHSNLTPEEETKRQNLLAENWDAPIVFTTQVQFLECLFGPGTRSARRMHQLANSVIIFDEIQTLPIRCVHMFNVALRFLVKGCGATAVLCTATQPLLDKVEPVQRALTIGSDQKIIPDERALFQKLKRYEAFDRRKIGGWTDEEVSELVIQELKNKGSVLIIVNTKKSARSLFLVITENKCVEVYHLSTNMCPAHRLEVLKTVKQKLLDKIPVVCVSTQLIEAGVDIDFGSVIRYISGLDSIIQAAGRCNRNGKPELGNVWIINPAQENIDKLKDIGIGRDVAERVLGEFNDDPKIFEMNRLGLEAMSEYYKYYFFQRREEMSYKIGKNSPAGREDDLFNLLSVNSTAIAEYQQITKRSPEIPFRQSFQTAAKAFNVIDSASHGVVVPFREEGRKIVNELCSTQGIENQYRLLKKAQRFSVNLLPHEFIMMVEIHAVQEVQKDSGIFTMDSQYYNDCFGWSADVLSGMDLLII